MALFAVLSWLPRLKTITASSIGIKARSERLSLGKLKSVEKIEAANDLVRLNLTAQNLLHRLF